MRIAPFFAAVSFISVVLTAGCAKNSGETRADATPTKHEHRTPHGGTAVGLGDGLYHLECVRETETGKLQVFVFDDELDNFVRVSMPSFRIIAAVAGQSHTLVLNAVANPATGETVGDSALFEAQADWLKSTKGFEMALESITIRGTTYSNVHFNFPDGNDRDK